MHLLPHLLVIERILRGADKSAAFPAKSAGDRGKSETPAPAAVRPLRLAGAAPIVSPRTRKTQGRSVVPATDAASSIVLAASKRCRAAERRTCPASETTSIAVDRYIAPAGNGL